MNSVGVEQRIDVDVFAQRLAVVSVSLHVMSATESWFGRIAVNCRATRSGGRKAFSSGRKWSVLAVAMFLAVTPLL